MSAIWFMRNFIRIKHPGAGIIPFDPFGYQRKAVRAFREHRLNIFRKCRQSGISKISGIFALWFAMFYSNKTILIVSRTEEDAKNFLQENVRLPFQNLPAWMQEMWLPKGSTDNAHSMEFANGSKIKSLTSAPDVLRSNASSLNIIDESAFIQEMGVMWAGGWPTLQHGGSVIVISTTNGVGNWYWSTWTDAEGKHNDFNPIVVNWWDMNWRIEYTDALTGRNKLIAPIEGIIPVKDGEVIEDPTYGRLTLTREKYGPYWSPWLEEQWRGLHEKGEGWKFAQEVLAEFLGSGNTVLSKAALMQVADTITDDFKIASGVSLYVNPISGIEEGIDLTPANPEEGLWVWAEPVQGTADKYQGGRLIEKGEPAHSYVMGVDIATGKGKDFQAIEVFDINTQEQVAEMMVHCLPSTFKKMVDYVGRYYNSALAVIERNNGGDDLIDDLQREFLYPRLWRRTTLNDKPTRANTRRKNPLLYAHYGHFTTDAAKSLLNRYLVDCIREIPGVGVQIYSRRLYKQLLIYVRKKNRAGHDTGKTEAETGPGNHDDLVMACAMALMGMPDAVHLERSVIQPVNGMKLDIQLQSPEEFEAKIEQFREKGGPGLTVPMLISPDLPPDQSALAELLRFQQQLMRKPKAIIQVVAQRRHRL